MAEFSGFSKSESVEDQIANVKKTLEWLMSNLDHNNVRQLYTEYCNIQSADGSTEIKGPQIIMKDAGGNVKLIQGLDPATMQFVFKLIDGLIVGGTIKTAETGARIEMSGNLFQCYDSDNKLTGMRFNPFMKDVTIYYAGDPLLTFSVGVNGMGQPINMHLQNRSGITLSVANHYNQAETNSAIDDAIAAHVSAYHTP